METKLFNIKGEEIGKVDIPEFIFSAKSDPHFLHEVIKYYLAAKRLGTVSTKTRGEVSGGGKKPWRQKHTGRARAGSIRSPLWRKGGVVFGPKPRDYSIDIPKAKRIKALIQALSAKNSTGELFVIENFNFNEAKTKNIYALLKVLKLDEKKVLIITEKRDEKLLLAANNIPNVKVMCACDLNAYDTLDNKAILIEKEALKIIEKRLEDK